MRIPITLLLRWLLSILTLVYHSGSERWQKLSRLRTSSIPFEKGKICPSVRGTTT
jgi:hypothetical protein